MKNKVDKVFSYTLIIAVIVVLFSLPVSIISDKLMAKDKYDKLYRDYRDIREEYAEEFAELSTAYEFLEDYYFEKIDEQNNTIEYLTDIIDSIVGANGTKPHTEEYVLQMRNDFEVYVNHIFNYYESGFKDSNPDVSLEQYIKIKDVELYNRLVEY